MKTIIIFNLIMFQDVTYFQGVLSVVLFDE